MNRAEWYGKRARSLVPHLQRWDLVTPPAPPEEPGGGYGARFLAGLALPPALLAAAWCVLVWLF